jgi:uncharacterized protein (DUF362 family)
MNDVFESLTANQVFCAHTAGGAYGAVINATFTELPEWAKATPACGGLRSVLADAGLDHEHLNSAAWNPLGALIEGKKVVLKPNWVYHENASGQGLDCLITHVSVLEALLHYVAKGRPAAIVLGDAPIQGCDFTALLVHSGVAEMIDRFAAHGIEVEVKDFRRTIRPGGKLATKPVDGGRSLDEFILFDLGAESALEEITQPDSEFRVTMYNPDLLKRTHAPGKHQYLVARDVIEGDVIISVPKLKTHKKACITGALKNLVGINGHKEYLPHHRKGNPQNGGDCYPEPSSVKALVEDLADATNRSEGKISRWLLANSFRAGTVFGRWLNLGDNYEGSWHGNDTVWRMTLDLQRILLYGRQDGTLAEAPQRTVVTVTDAIIAGEGDGPLAPTPVDLGMMTLGGNSAAVEWVNALLIGLKPAKIPLTREAFARNRYPLADFGPESVAAMVNGKRVRTEEIFQRYGRAFRLPPGWEKPFTVVSAEATA